MVKRNHDLFKKLHIFPVVSVGTHTTFQQHTQVVSLARIPAGMCQGMLCFYFACSGIFEALLVWELSAKPPT